MADQRKLKEAMTLIDNLTRNLDTLPERSTDEFSTEGVNRIADSFDKAGRPVLAQCFRDLAKQRDELAARLASTPPADAALADRLRAIADMASINSESTQAELSPAQECLIYEAAAALRTRAVPEERVPVDENIESSITTIRDFVKKVTHWQEGQPDKHTALKTIDVLVDQIEWIEKGIVEWRDEALKRNNLHIRATPVEWGHPSRAEVLERALDGLVDIVERVGCSDWRNEAGIRLKDTPQWVEAYVVLHRKGYK